MPYLIEEGFTKTELGFALSAISISYGISKFVMAIFSDRSNPRMFLPAGLILSALISLLMGVVPFFTSSVTIMFVMLFLNGWFQGMGWPPSGRVLVHWFSVSERGSKTAIWNVAHNVGGGLMAPSLLQVQRYLPDFPVIPLPGMKASLSCLLSLRLSWHSLRIS